MRHRSSGFTVVELLVSLAVMGIIMAAVTTTFRVQSKASILQDRSLEMEDNLRVAMHFVTDAMRNAGYGVPRTNLSTWLSNTYGTTTVPLIAGTNTLTLGACTSTAVAAVSTSTTATGVTSLSVNTTTDIAVGNTVWIGWAEFAKVTSKTGTSITFDTNPVSTAGNQGLYRTYPAGTPICRVDTQTFSVSSTNKTLSYDRGDGSGIQILAENISAMSVETVTARRRYRVTLTGIMKDPRTNENVTQSISSDVVFVN